MNIKWIFLPIGYLYGAVTSLRNLFFRVKILKKYQPSVFTLSVGNLQVGGTGKTPHVEYLLNLFKNQEIAVLSRGYGRKTKGFLHANEKSSPRTIGDEPFQIYDKSNGNVNVYVCEDRRSGVLEIMKIKEPSVILLDDAFQHQYITPHLNLLLTTFDEPFTKDEMLPAGRLREFRNNANRADAIIVTKCPEQISEKQKALIAKDLSGYIDNNKPIFFSRYTYENIVSYNKKSFDTRRDTVLISGIAKPELFEKYCESSHKIVMKYRFSDHHEFKQNSIIQIVKKHGKVQYLTSEKDFAKIKAILPEDLLNYFYYLPIKVRFGDKKRFDDFILTTFASYKSR